MEHRNLHVTLIVIFILCLFVGNAGCAEEKDNALAEEGLLRLSKPFTGDFDQMAKDRLIRVMMPYSKTFYFFDGAKPRGASYELVKLFEEFLNKKLKTTTLRLHTVIIPTAREDLISSVRDGKGDIAVGNLTITEARLKDVDFSSASATGVNEILVSHKKSSELKSIFDLAGKKIFARKSSSYYESLVKLNEVLRSAKKKEVIIAEADDHLEDEDLLEMINAGIIEFMVIDSHKGEFWAQILDNIKLQPSVKLRTGGSIAWAVRKNNPKLKAVINEFLQKHKLGTMMGNVIFNRYLKDTSYITDSIQNEHLKRFKIMANYFEKYGKQYQFDYLMLAALGYQESRLNQNLRSNAGAVGVMQVLPSTAKDKNVGIPNIKEAEQNIHAGTKYLRFMADTYFSEDKELDPLNRALFAFASYNAGPARISRLRQEAKKMGLDHNKWFNNVEIVAAKRIGRETVQYVSNIFKYYVAYALLADKMKIEGPVHLKGSFKKKKIKKQ
ncbi:MAG: lytic transglycosylase F [Deltaproteobacteria bacterium]|nr:lytic transglycosylase F [Deltaproteobacteria bacterium]